MPHIAVHPDLPGIIGLLHFRPDIARSLNELADTMLCGPNTLSRGERELIASYVSGRNGCTFCARSHSAIAAALLDGDTALVGKMHADLDSAPISGKLKALLRIADQVRQGGLNVTGEDVTAARAAGATDTEIHDTVLIAAMFCMFNRYVDGLATVTPPDAEFYAASAEMISRDGYRAAAGLPS